MINVEYDTDKLASARIAILGVGGGGSNAANHMVRKGLSGATVIAANTDAQALDNSIVEQKVVLGREITKGLGAGSNPEIGREAAEESADDIRAILDGNDMLFLATGLGGGTGTGGAPVIARLAREMGILTVGVVTKPFRFEGSQRLKKAEEGYTLLKEEVDALLAISNQRLLDLGRTVSVFSAFSMVDDVLYLATRSVVDIIQQHGLINVDFADVRTVMSGSGLALMGMGEARGEDRAQEAALKALNCPLLDGIESIQGANGVLVNVSSPVEEHALDMDELDNVLKLVSKEALRGSGESEVIHGIVADPELDEQLRVTVIATGIKESRGFSTYARASGETAFRASEQKSGLFNLGGNETAPQPRWEPAQETDWERNPISA